MTALLDAALSYADAGMAVLPCRGKVPCIRGGVGSASRDPDRIRRWWREFPRANIGVAMGASGLLAIDADRNHGDGSPDGVLAFRDVIDALAPSGEPDPWEGWVQRTPRGGRHFIFRAKIDCERFKCGSPLPGVDLKYGRSYLIVAPSRTEIGEYQGNGKPPIPLPAWIDAWLVARGMLRTPPRAAPREHVPARARSRGGATRLGNAVLARAIVDIRTATEGHRNTLLNRSAYTVTRFILAGHLPPSALDDVAAAVPRGHAGALGDMEIARTLASARAAAERDGPADIAGGR